MDLLGQAPSARSVISLVNAACCHASLLPRQIGILGWKDWDGIPHEGEPSDLSQVWSQFVHVSDPDTGEDQHLWAYVPKGLKETEDWEWWYNYIDMLAAMYEEINT